MFHLFEQLPRDIQREILLSCPNLLTKIICVSKNIHQLVINDVYTLLDVNASGEEMARYLRISPSRFLICKTRNNAYIDIIAIYYNETINEYEGYIETLRPGVNGWYSISSVLPIIRGDRIIVSTKRNHYFNDVDYYDLKSEYEIYSRRVSHMNKNQQYAKLKIRERLIQIYNKYIEDKSMNLVFFLCYLNHNIIIFHNKYRGIDSYPLDDWYNTLCITFDFHDLITSDKLQTIKDYINTKYQILINIIDQL